VSLPTREEINVYDSLDERIACEHFLGKTLDEAETLFRENSGYYQEDLMWMGPRAFAFYLDAALSYLRSDAGAGDDHFVDCLQVILRFRRDEEGFALALDGARRLVDYVVDSYVKFDPSGECDDLRNSFRELQEQLGGR
jgi:hypothetical protein